MTKLAITENLITSGEFYAMYNSDEVTWHLFRKDKNCSVDEYVGEVINKKYVRAILSLLSIG